ncbi:MAG: heat-inducible transcription repressor HrcA [Ignavibacteriales bacterium]|nr:heat-inducible transcription repressor HrcA [Ignavibacteriales bacterium]
MTDLTEREKAILRYVIYQFILTANPVGSRMLSKKFNLNLSSASIRNTMSDLEELGLLNHTHTSSGRVPTEKGYRLYVDSLMDEPKLETKEKKIIKAGLDSEVGAFEELLQMTSSILSQITKNLACVTYPKLDKAILDKIQIIPISSARILVVVTIKSGLVKTITLELKSDINESKFERIQQFLNERLSGLTFCEIRQTFQERVRDLDSEEFKPIVRLFIDSADKIFPDIQIADNIFLTGTKNILSQPEFADSEKFQSIIELIEDKDIIIHLMDKKRAENVDKITVSIGSENEIDKLSDYSVVIKNYNVGEVTGSVAVIGPKRMQYSKTIAAIIYVAEVLSKAIKGKE